jgi:hypothetical protein
VPRLKFGPTRDAVLLISGLLLLAHETLLVDEPRAILIGIAAAMIGLPATFFADRKFLSPSKPDQISGQSSANGENKS